MNFEQFRFWYEEAKTEAIAANIPLEELDWFAIAQSNLDRLALRLGTVPASGLQLSQPLPELARLWQRRCRDRVPVQYLVGWTHWRNFRLKVTPDVLIPRPETEEIIDLAVAAADSRHRGGDWVDLGTGSGAIALGLAAAFPEATIHAIDTSAEALEIARENARNCGFEKNVEFHQGAWWEPVEALKGRICGMTSNPPYIPTAAIARLQPEVACHEPHLALDGGADGLDCLRYLVETAPEYLGSRGIWLVEMMDGQGEAVKALLEEQGRYREVQTFPDLAGIQRFARAVISRE
ncbi:MAG: peptide chain release factor N(5)-glutamine methyltransferase [Cyanobacteriota bacterium]|nr:peptide chain release factor N(5)-glutamine methyltransferase [Cyanobacteriota bacterium]